MKFVDEFGLIHERESSMKPLTNYDLLIRKSPEEIAKALNDIQYTSYIDGMFSATMGKYPTTYSGWLDWLLQEVSE